MSAIEDARRLAGAEPVIHNKMTSENECAMCMGVSGDHVPECPWLAMPRIVAALEAAERHLRSGHPGDWFAAAEALGVAELRNRGRE